MKLSISNIAWENNQAEEMYLYLKNRKYNGLEIAPPSIFGSNPYDKLKDAKNFKNEMKNRYNLEISSIQSIWYGRKENIFNSYEEREILLNYTKKAILFAKELQCNNIVFGCPKNRVIGSESDINVAYDFFGCLGDYAQLMNTTLSLEANPEIYGTNFINTTEDAFSFVKKIEKKGIKINLDIGTMIYNNENLDILNGNLELINHIHISEPYLKLIEKRKIYKELRNYLNKNNYKKYVSIEMGKQDELIKTKDTIDYIYNIFMPEEE